MINKIISLCILLLFCSTQNLMHGQNENYERLLEALRTASREDRAQAIQKLVEDSITITINKVIDDPIRSDSAEIFTNYYLKYNDLFGISKDRIEKSVFFRKQEIQTLLDLPNSSGIRVYFGKYPYDFNIMPSESSYHEFINKNTVILRATYGINDYPYLMNGDEVMEPYPAIDYGDICPPNCSPLPNDIRNARERRLGNSNTKHKKGGYYTKNGDLMRTEPIPQN